MCFQLLTKLVRENVSINTPAPYMSARTRVTHLPPVPAQRASDNTIIRYHWSIFVRF